MFGLLNKGGAENLPLSRFHFWGLGTRMMQKVMKQNRMPGVPELMETAKELGVRYIACTTTLGLMGISKDTLIESIDEFAGVTTYLAEAKQGSVNFLFDELAIWRSVDWADRIDQQIDKSSDQQIIRSKDVRLNEVL